MSFSEDWHLSFETLDEEEHVTPVKIGLKASEILQWKFGANDVQLRSFRPTGGVPSAPVLLYLFPYPLMRT